MSCLCAGIHDEVDNGYSLGNSVWRDQEGKEHYLLWNVAKGIENPLIDRVLEAGSAAETESPLRQPAGEDVGDYQPLSAAPPASGESSAGERDGVGVCYQPDALGRTRPSSLSPAPFSLETWCAEGMQLVYFGIALRDSQDEVRFQVGDWFNKGEQALSERAYGFLRGFEDVTVRQYSWVAGRVAPDTRVSELSWSHARAVAALEPPKQKEWLERAQEENLSSKGLYQAIHGKRVTVRRWSAEELREQASIWPESDARPFAITEDVFRFIDWLETKCTSAPSF